MYIAAVDIDHLMTTAYVSNEVATEVEAFNDGHSQSHLYVERRGHLAAIPGVEGHNASAIDSGIHSSTQQACGTCRCLVDVRLTIKLELRIRSHVQLCCHRQGHLSLHAESLWRISVEKVTCICIACCRRISDWAVVL